MKTYQLRGERRWLCVIAVIGLLAGYTYWVLDQPLAPLEPVRTQSQRQTLAAAPQLSWPAAGQSAIGIAGSPTLAIHGAQTPAPTASTAKLITALVVLQAKPLSSGEQGPTITLGPNDVAIYNAYAAQDGSLVPVTAGEQVSEYQMLEAMLLPSANNMADSLATWAFGSLAAYSNSANNYLTKLGLTRTHVGTDASGFAPSTTSTAHDLVRLGELAMQDPVLSQIVGQATADGIPVVGSIKNVNSLLGNSGIIGVKTGNTDQAGGVFVGATRVTVNNRPVIIVTATVGAPSLAEAMKSSLPFIQSAQTNFQPVTVIKAGATAGQYHLPWGGTVSAVAAKNLSLAVWNGGDIASAVQLQPVAANSPAGTPVGIISIAQSVTAAQKSVTIKLQTAPTKPSAWWRLLHPVRGIRP